MAHPDKLQPTGQERQAFGLWKANDEAITQATGILGELTVVQPRFRRPRFVDFEGLPDVNIKYILHSDGTVDEIVSDPVTSKIIPQSGGFKGIGGRIETEPKFGRKMLKFTEVPDPNT